MKRVLVKSSAPAEKIGHRTYQKNACNLLSVLSPLQPTNMSLRFHDFTNLYRYGYTYSYGIGMKYRSHIGRTENKSDL